MWNIKSLKDGVDYIFNCHGEKVSRETIRACLIDFGLKSMVKPLKPLLTSQHMINRFSFSQEMIGKPETFWHNVIFTDESKYNLYGPDGYKRVWRDPQLPLENHHVRHVVKYGGGSVMVWGFITYYGVGKFIFIETKMNAEVFIDTLSSGFRQTLDMHNLRVNEIVLQMDNNSKHTAKRLRVV